MDKLAAEKLAAEYYVLGVQKALQDLNLGHEKTANILKNLGLVSGGAAGGVMAMKNKEMLLKAMDKAQGLSLPDIAGTVASLPSKILPLAF